MVLVAHSVLAAHAQIVVEALQTLVPMAADGFVTHIANDVAMKR